MHHSFSACLGFIGSVVCDNFLKINRHIFSLVFLFCSICMQEFSFARLIRQSRNLISVRFWIFSGLIFIEAIYTELYSILTKPRFKVIVIYSLVGE